MARTLAAARSIAIPTISIVDSKAGVASTTGATSYPTTTIYPNANRLYLASVCSTSGNGAAPSSVTGWGLTWVSVRSYLALDTNRRLSVYRTQTGASVPTAGVVTANFAGSQTGCNIAVQEVAGADLSGSEGSAAIGASGDDEDADLTTGTLVITLESVPDSTSATFSALGIGSNGNQAEPVGGFAELVEMRYNTPNNGLANSWKSTADQTVEWQQSSGGSRYLIGIGIEIKAAKRKLIASRTLASTRSAI